MSVSWCGKGQEGVGCEILDQFQVCHLIPAPFQREGDAGDSPGAERSRGAGLPHGTARWRWQGQSPRLGKTFNHIRREQV